MLIQKSIIFILCSINHRLIIFLVFVCYSRLCEIDNLLYYLIKLCTYNLDTPRTYMSCEIVACLLRWSCYYESFVWNQNCIEVNLLDHDWNICILHIFGLYGILHLMRQEWRLKICLSYRIWIMFHFDSIIG